MKWQTSRRTGSDGQQRSALIRLGRAEYKHPPIRLTEQYTTTCSLPSTLAAPTAATTYSLSILLNASALPALARVVPSATRTAPAPTARSLPASPASPPCSLSKSSGVWTSLPWPGVEGSMSWGAERPKEWTWVKAGEARAARRAWRPTSPVEPRTMAFVIGGEGAECCRRVQEGRAKDRR